jgi:hypothetical protein
MGMEHVVRFPDGRLPDLARMMAILEERQFPVQVRMVDGALILPDEVPPDGWKEVRLGTPAGMVTLMRRGQELAVVTWGNADQVMQSAWNAVAWAAANAGQGKIVRPGRLQSAGEFRASVLMPESMQQ